jgi:acetyl esterase/lipase
VILGLAALTVKASRDGVWLLFMLLAPAAHSTRVKRQWNGLLPVGAAVALALLALDVARPLTQPGASPALVRRAVALAHGTPILADAIAAEQVALAGGRIWAGNPLDAFSHRVQGEYLDWLAGARSGAAALDNRQVRVVLVTRGTAPQLLTSADPSFIAVASDRRTTIYVRRAAAKLRDAGPARRRRIGVAQAHWIASLPGRAGPAVRLRLGLGMNLQFAYVNSATLPTVGPQRPLAWITDEPAAALDSPPTDQ